MVLQQLQVGFSLSGRVREGQSSTPSFAILHCVVVGLGCVQLEETLVVVPAPARGTVGPGEMLGGVAGGSPGETDVVGGELAGVAGLGDHTPP